jgi:hypothetical protein
MQVQFQWGQDSSVGIVTGYGLDGPGIKSRWGWIFCKCPDRPWGPPSLLYSGQWVFPGGKAAGAWCWPPIPFYSWGQERVELYLYSCLGLRVCYGVPLPSPSIISFLAHQNWNLWQEVSFYFFVSKYHHLYTFSYSLHSASFVCPLSLSPLACLKCSKVGFWNHSAICAHVFLSSMGTN